MSDQQFNFDDLPNPQPGVRVSKPKPRRSGCLLGIILLLLATCATVIVVVVFAGNTLGSVLSNFGGFGNLVATVSSAVQPPESRPITGDASRFDPMAGLKDAQAFAGKDAQLATISATYVRSDGTMDLTATYSPAPNTEYTFLREIPRPADAPPVGVAGSTDGQWYEPITIEAFKPGQRRHVTTTSGGVRASFTYVNEGMLKQVEEPTTRPFDEVAPAPACAFTDLWETAIDEGAPEDAVAIIEYDVEGYTFNISGTMVLRFDHDCNLEA